MQFQQLAVREQLEKTVVRSGNGGAVWVPKAWLGEKVIVILPQRPGQSIQSEIISCLSPYLKDILAIAIVGSYARKEQSQESDIDVLVITKEKQLAIQGRGRLEITSLPIAQVPKAIKSYPEVYYPMIVEAEPIINSQLFEELKDVKVEKEDYHNFIKASKEHIKSSKALLALDREDGTTLKSFSALYSTFLRLRNIFNANCLLRKQKYTNMAFRQWISKKLPHPEVKNILLAFQEMKKGKSPNKIVIPLDTAEKLIALFEHELERWEK